jgi:AraC-like DNA-binding protein
MNSATTQGTMRPVSNEAAISSRIARTEHVRVEFLHCGTEATVQWSSPRPEVSLMWVRDKSRNTRITMAGCSGDNIAPGRANFWFFPEGVDAQGQVTGKGAYDCAGVFIEPSFLPSSVKQALAEPMVGFAHDGLGRAFEELADELIEPDEVLPLFTDGWAMRALAYVARASKGSQVQANSGSGLAPWQLRRAQEMFRADLSENLSLSNVAKACRLSASHFARAFKASTGMPPHQWVLRARIETARGLLVSSSTPLVEIADICGFADQSHFSRVFGRTIGSSPGAFRREHRV